MGILAGIRSIEELPLENQRAFLRLDLDGPQKPDAAWRERRVRAALPTIERAIKGGARVVLAARLGRPSGPEHAAEFSLEPVGSLLSELLKSEVFLPDDCIGDAARKVVQDLRPGQICLLENLGFHREEAENDESFAQKLAQFADVYVNDALRDSDSREASVAALPRLVRERGMGLELAKELAALAQIIETPKRPLVLVVGGGNAQEKLGLVESLLDRVDAVLVGGAIGNTLLAARGVDLKDSPLDSSLLSRGRALLDRARDKKIDFLLPLDVMVADKQSREEARPVPVAGVPAGARVVDVGPETLALFAERVARAETALWCGPLGIRENSAFRANLLEFARRFGEAQRARVVIGADTQQALVDAGEDVTSSVGFVSAGGRASLALIQGRKLPGIEALRGGAT